MRLPVLALRRPCPLQVTEDQDFFCSRCEQHVYALSRRTETEAMKLLQRPDGPPCISYRTDARGQVRFAGRRTTALLSVVLAAGCATSRPESSHSPDDPVCIARQKEGISIGGGGWSDHPYQTEGVNVSNPAFGALTITIIIDGRRHHFGVGG